jgi:hypothetical protein
MGPIEIMGYLIWCRLKLFYSIELICGVHNRYKANNKMFKRAFDHMNLIQKIANKENQFLLVNLTEIMFVSQRVNAGIISLNKSRSTIF